MGVGAALRVHDPARDLAEAGEPHVVVPAHVIEKLVEHRGHQRTPAIVAMQRCRQEGRRFALAQIIERLLVDLEEIEWIAAQGAHVGEVAAGDLNDRAGPLF